MPDLNYSIGYLIPYFMIVKNFGYSVKIEEC
jgi:hypothetical protein